MSGGGEPEAGLTRRGLVRAAAGSIAATAGTGLGLPTFASGLDQTKRTGAGAAAATGQIEPFRGRHQGGIINSPVQHHIYAAAFDLVTPRRDDVIGLLRLWTAAAERMTRGEPARPAELHAAGGLAPDSGEALGLSAARLSLTFGLGGGLFVKDGKDRYGLAAQRPPAFADLPRFNGDELIEGQTGGDLLVQACADDPQIAFHAVRQLARMAYRVAVVRWAQTGFIPGLGQRQTPRNLMGFKDGTSNPSVHDAAAMQQFVWVGDEGPDWMRSGSYVVLRRIRIALEHWDRMPLDFQERTFGRHKDSGAPLGRQAEFDPLDLNAADTAGEPVIPENAHVRLAAAASNDGARILRRPYSYNDGTDFITERWEPWRRAREYDAGLFFVCYQRDPRTGFIKIFDKLAKFDMLNQFVTHTGGGLFACPGGAAPGEFVGQRLLTSPRPRRAG
jgi:deferrochelatase/peroxidase EfeB